MIIFIAKPDKIFQTTLINSTCAQEKEMTRSILEQVNG